MPPIGSGIDIWRGAGPRAHFCNRFISLHLCSRNHGSIPGPERTDQTVIACPRGRPTRVSRASHNGNGLWRYSAQPPGCPQGIGLRNVVLTPVSRSGKPACLRSGPTWDRSKATTERLRMASTLSIGHCLARREPVIGDSPQDSSSLTCGIPKVVTARLRKAEFAGLRARATTCSRPPLRCLRTRPDQLGDAPWSHPDRTGAAR